MISKSFAVNGFWALWDIMIVAMEIPLKEAYYVHVLQRSSYYNLYTRIFGPKRDEVTGEWRKLHNEELHNLYLSPDIIRQVKANEVGRACSTHGREEKSVQGFGGKARGKETTRKTKAGGMGLDWILGSLAGRGWIGFDWLRTGTGGELLRMR
jgi:hypothetical protein